ncbi:MAG: hypothetical protein EAZ07_02060 [Cytophagales bacterium]|nr:MAG: hypothetical protein EAZ07_02060 [Cytophagales bacterium]
MLGSPLKQVTFDYKDYKAKGEKKLMTLTHGEFIRRFAMHQHTTWLKSPLDFCPPNDL